MKITEQPILPNQTATPWRRAQESLVRGDTYWLATVRSDGRPHVMPLLAVWVDGAPHFVANARSRKARDLAARPDCVLTTTSGDFDLVVEGTAVIIRDEIDLRRVAEGYATKYGWPVEVRGGAFHGEGAPTAGPAPYDVYRVTPTTVFAFGHDESVAPTRYGFAS